MCCFFFFRELYVCYNIKITNKGLRSLCVDDGHVGKCRKLSVLTVEFTKVDKVGLLSALENLPNLAILEHSSVSDAALEWCYSHLESTLKLQQLTFDMSTVNNIELHDLVVMCPDLHALEFRSSSCRNSVDASPFLSMKMLSKFKSENSIIPQISWFMHLGGSLTDLYLVGENFIDEIDLTILGKSCPNLERLTVQEILLVESEFHDGDHFKLIKDVSLNNERHAYNLERNLNCILGSEHLQSFKFTGFQFSDEFFMPIFQKASNDRKTFSQLQDLELIECNMVTEKTLKSIICVAPRLVKMSMNHCERFTFSDSSNLAKFIDTNKLSIVLDWN